MYSYVHSHAGAVVARVQCSHEGSRATRVLFTDSNALLSTGVNVNGERELALWDVRQVRTDFRTTFT